jgi:rare lipoprotein A
MGGKTKSGRGAWAAAAGVLAVAVAALVVLQFAPNEAPSPELASPRDNAAQNTSIQDQSSQDTTFRQTGHASWYDFSGEETASGEIMDEDDMTAAHRSLPFGTKLRVENLENGEDVTVRVNDRGPYAKDRIIDVSAEAAERLDMTEDGVMKVRIKKVAPPDANANSSSNTQAD